MQLKNYFLIYKWNRSIELSISKILFLIGSVFLGLYGFYIADIFNHLFFKYSIIIGMFFFTISIILDVVFYIKYKKSKK